MSKPIPTAARELSYIRRDLERIAKRLASLDVPLVRSTDDSLVRRVLDAAWIETGISPGELTSERRNSETFRARCAVIFIVRELAAYSLPRIGRALGGRDHTTIMSALRRANALRATDAAFERMLHNIETRARAAIKAERMPNATTLHPA